MKLLLDEHHDPLVAERLRGLGHDVVAVAERPDLRGRPDTEIWLVAQTEGRTVVTESYKDFASLVRDAADRGEAHAGVVFTSPSRYPRVPHAVGSMVAALASLLERHPSPEALRDVVLRL